MSQPDFLILYVDNPQVSAAFYSRLMAIEPVESGPTFAMFAMDSGLKLGLWSKHTVEPASSGAAGIAEVVFSVKSDAEVDAHYREWKEKGLQILQELTTMDFGYTFVALDPDGHRLRVYMHHQ